MKAIFFEKHGGIEVLKFADLPEPKLKPNEVLIEVKAVSLNHLDIWVRKGWKGLLLEMPHITGSDIAGTISDANGHAGLKTGMKIVVNPGYLSLEDEWSRQGLDSLSPGYRIIGEHCPGGLAQFVAVPATCVYKLPEEIDFESAASMPLVGLTCWRMLLKQARLKPGESVLVVGSGGGVNSLSILLASTLGASVFALAGSSEKAEMAKSLGAGSVIEYDKEPRWDIEILKQTRGRGVDIVIDNVGAPTLGKSFRAAARGGRIVTVGNTKGCEVVFDNRLIFTKQISLIGSTMGSKQDFIDAMEFMWSKNIKPPIDSILPLKDGIEAIQRMEEGQHFGKIILRP